MHTTHPSSLLSFRGFVRLLITTIVVLASLSSVALAAPGGSKGRPTSDTGVSIDASVADPASAGVAVRTASYNISHGVGTDGVLDLERTARAIEATGADIIGLQEVDRHFHDRSAWEDQAGWLADRLGMFVAYGPALDLDPLVEGAPRRQYGNAVLSRFPIVAVSNVVLPNHGNEQRAALDTRVDVGGVRVRFISTHLTNRDSGERAAQTDAIAKLVGHHSSRTVVVGDFNASASAREMRVMHRVLDDAWAGLPLTTDGNTYPSTAPLSRIDYVFSSQDLVATSGSVPATLASDHLPVVIDLAAG